MALTGKLLSCRGKERIFAFKTTAIDLQREAAYGNISVFKKRDIIEGRKKWGERTFHTDCYYFTEEYNKGHDCQKLHTYTQEDRQSLTVNTVKVGGAPPKATTHLKGL